MTLKITQKQQGDLILMLQITFKKTSCFSEIEKYITILLRKMKIQEDVVWDNILVSR